MPSRWWCSLRHLSLAKRGNGARAVSVESWQQALTVFLVVVPGFVYQGCLARLRGPLPVDRDLLGARILRALTASGIFGLVYVVILGPVLGGKENKFRDHARDYLVANPSIAAILLLVLVFGIPFAVGYAHYGLSVRRKYAHLSWKERFWLYKHDPTAWDFAVNGVGATPKYVRICTKDGQWRGGYAGEASFFTTYPDPREIFVEEAWVLDEKGQFTRSIKGTSQWIQCDDAAVVEFVELSAPPGHLTGLSKWLAIAFVLWAWGRRVREMIADR